MDIENVVKVHTEWIHIMKAFGYNSCNHVPQLHKKLQKLGIDYSHVDEKYTLPKAMTPLEDILVKDSLYTSGTCLKRRLKRELNWEHKCSWCKNTEWNNQPIPIQVDHINGDHTDNRINNLRFLCPNCHAQTDTYAREYEDLQGKEKSRDIKRNSRVAKRHGKSNSSNAKRHINEANKNSSQTTRKNTDDNRKSELAKRTSTVCLSRLPQQTTQKSNEMS